MFRSDMSKIRTDPPSLAMDAMTRNTAVFVKQHTACKHRLRGFCRDFYDWRACAGYGEADDRNRCNCGDARHDLSFLRARSAYLEERKGEKRQAGDSGKDQGTN